VPFIFFVFPFGRPPGSEYREGFAPWFYFQGSFSLRIPFFPRPCFFMTVSPFTFPAALSLSFPQPFFFLLHITNEWRPPDDESPLFLEPSSFSGILWAFSDPPPSLLHCLRSESPYRPKTFFAIPFLAHEPFFRLPSPDFVPA